MLSNAAGTCGTHVRRVAATRPCRPAGCTATTPLRRRLACRRASLAPACAAAPQLVSTLAASSELLEALHTPSGQLAAGAVAAAVVAAALFANSPGALVTGRADAAAGEAQAQRVCSDGVLVFGAGGRLGRSVVLELLRQGRCVVAAARDAAKTTATLTEAAASAGVSVDKLFVRGGVDVTEPGTLNADLFAGCTQVVVATGAVFGRTPDGKMGYIDNMTSERVDALGNANIAAAAAQHVPRPARQAFAPVATFTSEEDLQRWRRMDDVIMGGNSSSAWRLLDGEPSGPVGEWSGDLVMEGGGFCGCRCDGLDLDLARADGLVIRLRGDGQRYKLNLKTALYDGKPECTYQAIIDTSLVPQGQFGDVTLLWSDFVPVARQVEDPQRPAVDPSTVRSLGFVLSRFEFNGLPNYSFRPGPFKLQVASITPFAAPRPALVMISSAGVERNARIGDDAELRKKDIPIVQLNPGGVLNWKYKGETAVRFDAGSLPYTIIRPTGLDAGADTSSLLELGQGDAFAGKVSRAEVALVTAVALGSPVSANRTFELRRSEAAVDAGKVSGSADVARLMLTLVPDAKRTTIGLRPLPAPCAPPAPVTPQRKQEILSRDDVQASLAAGRGARTRSEEEAAPGAAVKTSAAEDASLWIANWRARRQSEAPGAKASEPQKELVGAR